MFQLSSPDLVNNNDWEEEFEVDFLAIGETYVDNIFWQKASDNNRTFELYHPELKGEIIKLREFSALKQYTINIDDITHKIVNYRTVDFDFNIHRGPALIGLSLKNAEGKSTGPSLLLEFDNDGLLAECVFPEEEIHFADSDVLAPCFIIRDRKLITLPINVNQYLRIKEIQELN